MVKTTGDVQDQSFHEDTQIDPEQYQRLLQSEETNPIIEQAAEEMRERIEATTESVVGNLRKNYNKSNSAQIRGAIAEIEDKSPDDWSALLHRVKSYLTANAALIEALDPHAVTAMCTLLQAITDGTPGQFSPDSNRLLQQAAQESRKATQELTAMVKITKQFTDKKEDFKEVQEALSKQIADLSGEIAAVARTTKDFMSYSNTSPSEEDPEVGSEELLQSSLMTCKILCQLHATTAQINNNFIHLASAGTEVIGKPASARKEWFLVNADDELRELYRKRHPKQTAPPPSKPQSTEPQPPQPQTPTRPEDTVLPAVPTTGEDPALTEATQRRLLQILTAAAESR
jgi:hypothetical protein